MKIDEALNVLKQYIDYNNPDVPDFYTMEEACEVVIKALEQEPCGDAISRQMLKAKMFDLPKPPSNKTYWDGVDDVGDLIDKLPPVTSTKKVGHWIYIGNKDINQSVKIVECNVCHKRNMGSSDYCPSCGRKMQEVKNNEADN